MSWLILKFIVGLLLLLGGGEALVRGAGVIARGFGVPTVIIGMTIVAFGTSAPELVIAITGAATGAGGVVFGNAVGANIVNIGLILGATAVLLPLTVHRTIVTREIPMLILAMTAAWVLSIDSFLDGTTNRLARGDGLILCLLFGVFIYYTVVSIRRTRRDSFIMGARDVGKKFHFSEVSTPAGLVIIGLICLGIGGNLLVESAVTIADKMGMTQAMIGLTIVSIGTTFPELATSILAARKGEADLAVGNLVGSNIFNILLVLGVSASISPIEVPARGPTTLAIGTGLSLLLVVLIHTGRMRITRKEGLMLLAVFAAYLVIIATLW